MSTPATIDSLQAQVAALARAVEVMAGTHPLVDVAVAAEYLGVSPKTVRRLVAEKAIPFRRFGRQLRFNLAQLAPQRIA